MSPASPAFPQTVLDLLAAGGDRPCFEHGARTVTAAETLALIRRAVAGLRAAGLSAGDPVAIVPGVSPEGFAVLFAAYTVGLRVSAIRPGLTPAQLRHLLTEGGVAALLLDPAALPFAFDFAPRYRLDELLAHPDDGRPLVPAGRPDDIARISYTSGSTGLPKGCGTTYRSLAVDWPWRPDLWPASVADFASRLDRYLLFGTLSSPVVLDYLMMTLFHGGVGVTPDELPDPLFPAVVSRHRISGSIMTVARLYQLLDALAAGPHDVSSLQAIMVSGSPVNPRRYEEALKRLGPVVFQGYGLTELGAVTLLTPGDVARDGADALESVGRVHPFVDVEVRDPAGRALSAGEPGEVFVRAPYQPEGYFADPDQSAEVFLDGWVCSRDLGYVSANGYLHLIGRTREVIIVNAMVYYAGPIERVLARHPSVGAAYVVGAPDERTGEAIHAFVVPAEGHVPDPAELAAHVGAELGAGSVPATVTVIAEVPVGPSGKPDKKALLDL
jgi:fatty-acyl-CoA synthase